MGIPYAPEWNTYVVVCPPKLLESKICFLEPASDAGGAVQGNKHRPWHVQRVRLVTRIFARPNACMPRGAK